MMGRNTPILFLFFLFFLFAFTGSGESDILLNGTGIYLASGDSYGLYQGYVLSVKSVSSDGAVWLQLTENDKIVKSEIVAGDYFIYNKSNRTILSIKVDNIYYGSSEQTLVSLFPVYQYVDPDLPVPDITKMIPNDANNPVDKNPASRIQTPREPVIWAFGIVFILVLYYILRKLW
ncbi:MAG: S-layer protein domain-containing protein [Candidatus Methanoperedens sp.]|nr:S-layer protein domain-containing protein [Candidatus Methanoperedens sp.]MCZ7403824.1 S-layer protein domain-containing protein [Candidatus Methanoperedens sp.]